MQGDDQCGFRIGNATGRHMGTFDKREEGFESKFAHDEELRFKARARRNKLVGLWAAEKLGITGGDAEAYSDALAVGTLDPNDRDVFSKIRKDFDAAGVAESDDQILQVMNELTLQAADPNRATGGGATDAAAVMLARKLSPRG